MDSNPEDDHEPEPEPRPKIDNTVFAPVTGLQANFSSLEKILGKVYKLNIYTGDIGTKLTFTVRIPSPRQRDRERQRETKRDKEGQRETKRDRETERNRETERKRDTEFR